VSSMSDVWGWWLTVSCSAARPALEVSEELVTK
jgi:hypothetical protein